MKILYHHRTQGDGAEGVHIAEIVSALKELGHEVSVVCPKNAKRKPGLAPSKSRPKKIGFAMALVVKQIAEIAYNVVSYFRAQRGIRRHRPDFIYERYSAFNFGGIMAARSHRVPVILEVNATYAGKYGCRFKVYFSAILRWAESYVLRNATGIIVVSHPLKECVLSQQPNSDRIQVSPNGINVGRVSEVNILEARSTVRTKLEMSDESVVIGFVGSLRKWHGIDFFAEVIPLVAAQSPDVLFMIVGTGRYEASFRAAMDDAGLSDRIVFVGPVAHDDVLPHIAAMDIGVMPDSNDFGSPMKILEYMAMRCVAVAPRLRPVEEIVEDGKTGILFEQRDVDSFSQALCSLLLDSENRQRISKNAKDYVMSKRTWARNAQEIIDLYEIVSQ